MCCGFFFFNDTATTEIYTLSLPRRSSDLHQSEQREGLGDRAHRVLRQYRGQSDGLVAQLAADCVLRDRKSTRLNSSHSQISYAVFCLKKKKIHRPSSQTSRRSR